MPTRTIQTMPAWTAGLRRCFGGEEALQIVLDVFALKREASKYMRRANFR